MSKISLSGKLKCNYLWSIGRALGDSEISEIVSKKLYKPSWTADTVLLTGYTGSADSSNSGSTKDIEGFSIYKTRLGKEELTKAGDVDIKSGYMDDYKIPSVGGYRYYVYPRVESEGETSLLQPIETNDIAVNEYGVSLIGLVEDGDNYTVDKNNIWYFCLETSIDSQILNYDKTYKQGFGRFNKVQVGNKKYRSFEQVSMLLGSLEKNGEYTGDTEDEVSAFMDFCIDGTPKLYKDMDGNLAIVDIMPSPSLKQLHAGSIDRPRILTLDLAEIEDIDKKTVSEARI